MCQDFKKSASVVYRSIDRNRIDPEPIPLIVDNNINANDPRYGFNDGVITLVVQDP